MKYLKMEGYFDSLNVSKIALGTGSAMKQLTKDEIFKLLDMFANAGGNCLDTAPGYNSGRSEAYIGEWMRLHSMRNRMLISTKACHAFRGEPSRLSRQDMEQDLNQSLTAMGIDHVDMLWIHNDDEAVAVEGIVESINAIIRTGKVRAVGCSNWSVERIEKANRYALDNGLQGFFANQVQWSLARADRKAYEKAYGALVMDDAAYAWHLRNNMPVFAFSALAQGFFAKAASAGVESLTGNVRDFFASPDNICRLRNVEKYMAENKLPSSVPVLGYLMNNELKGVALISARTPEMLAEALLAADTEMSREEAEALFRVR